MQDEIYPKFLYTQLPKSIKKYGLIDVGFPYSQKYFKNIDDPRLANCGSEHVVVEVDTYGFVGRCPVEMTDGIWEGNTSILREYVKEVTILA